MEIRRQDDFKRRHRARALGNRGLWIFPSPEKKMDYINNQQIPTCTVVPLILIVALQ